MCHLNKPPGAITAIGNTSSLSTHSAERERDAFQAKLNTQLKSILDKIYASSHSWPFKEIVSKQEVYIIIYYYVLKLLKLFCNL